MRQIHEEIAVHYVHYSCILGEWRSWSSLHSDLFIQEWHSPSVLHTGKVVPLHVCVKVTA